MPKVSVIINCYNGEKFLQETLDSLKKQSYQDFEIVFWDNCSSDGTATIAKNYGQKMNYYRGDEVVSLGKARNFALEKVRGEYIAFLDADDLWEPSKLKQQVEIMESNTEIGLVCTNFVELNMLSGKRINVYSKQSGYLEFNDFIIHYNYSLSSFLIRVDAIRALNHFFDERLRYAEEFELFARIALKWKIFYLSDPLITYRIHKSMSSIQLLPIKAKEYNICIESLKKEEPEFSNRYPDVEEGLCFFRDFSDAKFNTSIGNNKNVRKLMRPYILRNHRALLFYLNACLPSVISMKVYDRVYQIKGF